MKKDKEYQRLYRSRNRERIQRQAKELVNKKKLEGFCTLCKWGTPAEKGATLCEKHLLARRNRRGEKTLEWQEKGMCSSCGQYPAEEGKLSCKKCLINGCKGVRGRGRRGKLKIVEYLGGKCERCGLITDCMPVYEIHHLSKKTKEFNMKTIQSRSWETIKKELDKGVQLLCANCHRIIQYNHEDSWANKQLSRGSKGKY